MPIVILLVLAAAPFVWVAVDMRRQEHARRRTSVPEQATARPALVIEQIDPTDAPALAA